MPGSSITVDDLALTAGFGQVFARWSVTDPYWNSIEQLRFDKVELWSRSVNDRGPDSALLATKVDEGIDRGEHIGLGSAVSNYYWARARDRSGNYGPWNPSSQTGGLLGTTAAITAADAVTSTDFLIASNGYIKLEPSGLLLQWGRTTTDASGEAIVDFPHPWTGFNLMRWIGGIGGSGNVNVDKEDVFSIFRHTIFINAPGHPPGLALGVKVKRIPAAGGAPVNAANMPIEWFAIGV